MKYESILFDLDGTLTDPGLGITNSVLYALSLRGIYPDRSEVYRFIGPPLHTAFCEYYGLTPEDATRAITDFRVYFEKAGMLENEVYEGIPEMLSRLQKEGKRLYVATSKPELYAKQILAHFGLMDFFTFVGGNTMAEDRTEKEDILTYVLAENPDIRPETAVMVGDRLYDIRGGKAFGLATVGVTYGYAQPGELESARADAVARSVAELYEILKA